VLRAACCFCFGAVLDSPHAGGTFASTAHRVPLFTACILGELGQLASRDARTGKAR
jgi:hypothetical protein